MPEKALFEMLPPATRDPEEKITFRCVECNINFNSNEIGQHALIVHGLTGFTVKNIRGALLERKEDA